MSRNVDGMTETYTLTGSELIVALSSGDAMGHHGMNAEWGCLGGDWFGIYVGRPDRRSCIITGGGGGGLSDPLTDGAVGFYDGGGWVADSSAYAIGAEEDPTATVAGCVAVVRSWIHDGDLPDGLVDGR